MIDSLGTYLPPIGMAARFPGLLHEHLVETQKVSDFYRHPTNLRQANPFAFRISFGRNASGYRNRSLLPGLQSRDDIAWANSKVLLKSRYPKHVQQQRTREQHKWRKPIEPQPPRQPRPPLSQPRPGSVRERYIRDARDVPRTDRKPGELIRHSQAQSLQSSRAGPPNSARARLQRCSPRNSISMGCQPYLQPKQTSVEDESQESTWHSMNMDLDAAGAEPKSLANEAVHEPKEVDMDETLDLNVTIKLLPFLSGHGAYGVRCVCLLSDGTGAAEVETYSQADEPTSQQQQLLQTSAMCIQRKWRSARRSETKALNLARSVLRDHEQFFAHMRTRLETESAVLIQAIYRGHAARARVHELLAAAQTEMHPAPLVPTESVGAPRRRSHRKSVGD